MTMTRGYRHYGGRRPKTAANGRVCANEDCDTLLSRYNLREFCHMHAPMRYPRTRGRVKRLRSAVRS